MTRPSFPRTLYRLTGVPAPAAREPALDAFAALLGRIDPAAGARSGARVRRLDTGPRRLP